LKSGVFSAQLPEFQLLPQAVTDSATAQIMVHSPLGLGGDWERLFIATYHLGGHIFFPNIDNDTIEAVFRFQ